MHNSLTKANQVVSDGRILFSSRDPPGQHSVYIRPGDPCQEFYCLSTFEKFPEHSPANPRQLAAAGFFHTGYKYRVKCFSCSQTVENWSPVMILFRHTAIVWIVSSFAAQITLTYLSLQHLRTRGHQILLPCWLPQRMVPQHLENHKLHCQALWLRQCLEVRTMSWLQLLQHPQTLSRLPRTLKTSQNTNAANASSIPNNLLNSFLVQTQSILTCEAKWKLPVW